MPGDRDTNELFRNLLSTGSLKSALNWIGCMAVAGLAIGLGSAPANAASVNEVLPSCKLYLSLVDRHGAGSQSEIPHLLDAGECSGAVYAMLAVSHTLAEPFKFCPPIEFDAEQGVRVVVAYVERKTRNEAARTSRCLRWKLSEQSGHANRAGAPRWYSLAKIQGCGNSPCAGHRRSASDDSLRIRICPTLCGRFRTIHANVSYLEHTFP